MKVRELPKSAVVSGHRSSFLTLQRKFSVPPYLNMADPCPALEVLREMDEVGARYFALTLRSQSSLQILVSAHSRLSVFVAMPGQGTSSRRSSAPLWKFKFVLPAVTPYLALGTFLG